MGACCKTCPTCPSNSPHLHPPHFSDAEEARDDLHEKCLPDGLVGGVQGAGVSVSLSLSLSASLSLPPTLSLMRPATQNTYTHRKTCPMRAWIPRKSPAVPLVSYTCCKVCQVLGTLASTPAPLLAPPPPAPLLASALTLLPPRSPKPMPGLEWARGRGLHGVGVCRAIWLCWTMRATSNGVFPA
jgi:hypothetical protein